jgi:hypothetical protein
MATRVEQFLAADEHNTRVAPDLMRLLHPWAFDAFEDCPRMFRLLYDSVGGWDVEHAEDRKLSEIARRCRGRGHAGVPWSWWANRLLQEQSTAAEWSCARDPRDFHDDAAFHKFG